MNTLPPIRRAILVEADPATAFEVFTAGLGRWWPLDELSVHGKDATVSFEGAEAGARIVERSAGGEAAVWGTVTRWEPPDAVAFTWHPGHHADEASYVEVTFIAGAPGQTMVRLEHSGWEFFADPAAARAEYDHGWPLVLDRYQERIAAQDADEDADTWVALLHRPGPQAPPAGSLTEDPRFGEHVAFLNRMREAGYLVLAGPLADADGEGMTVLRLPGPGRLGTATRLANEDDTSVASGFLSVTVRPWLVVMRGA
jgi:uncharacterized protein YndB with AHSA1/START domain/uncharacterized protein YciI